MGWAKYQQPLSLRTSHAAKHFYKGSELEWSLGKRPLKRRGLRSEHNIKTDVKEIGSEDWTDIAQERDKCRALVNTVLNLGVL